MPRHVFYEPGRAPVARDRGGSISDGDVLGKRHVEENQVERRRVEQRHVERFLDGCAHFVLPAWCLGCGGRLPWRHSPLGLCSACRRDLPRPPRQGCHACAAVGAAPGGRLCSACAGSRRGLDDLLVAWSYQPPVDAVIHRFKYGRLEFLADDLGAGIAAAIGESAQGHDWVTSVPLHWRRRLARGYDQAALLAASAAARLGLPYRPFLVRARSTPPQVSRSAAERRDNVAGAFRCRFRGSRALEGAAILLVDDVGTTGATLDAAGLALKAAGAARVVAAVAAWTPPERP